MTRAASDELHGSFYVQAYNIYGESPPQTNKMVTLTDVTPWADGSGAAHCATLKACVHI